MKVACFVAQAAQPLNFAQHQTSWDRPGEYGLAVKGSVRQNVQFICVLLSREPANVLRGLAGEKVGARGAGGSPQNIVGLPATVCALSPGLRIRPR